MATFNRITCLVLLAILAASVATSKSDAAEMITVTVKSGRQFTAEVDHRSDDSRLWLRFSTNSTTLLRPISWDSIVGAEYDGGDVTYDRLREIVDAIKSGADPSEELQSESVPPVAHSVETIPSPTETKTYSEQARDALGMSPQVRFIRFDAYLANWDGDVEADGLVVQVYPIDEDGEVIPVDGTLHVTLVGPRRRSFSAVPHGRGQSIERLGSWTKMVRGNQVGPGGAEYNLPFQASHPEFDTDIGTHGLVNIRFVIPGHGVFEDSLDQIRIRPFSPTRDHLELQEGRRFFPFEHTGRGKRTR